jgi:hypothetical protein
MTHCALLLIRLAKRFFAFLEMGVTSAVFMNLDVDVCNLVDDAGLVEIGCASMRTGTSRRDLRMKSRLGLEQNLD